jgi:glycosyltransferase involved in cell wall biosynthesis
MVTGDFTTWGGMDHANYQLAWYLANEAGAAVHLVAHSVAAPLRDHPLVRWHRVAKPMDRHALGGPLLARAARRVAAEVSLSGGRVVTNGGNCAWPDVNWVHAVHAAWPRRDRLAPWPFRLRAAFSKRAARMAERRSLRIARTIVTNSKLAREQLIERVGLAPDRVRTIYYGIDAKTFRPPSPDERAEARTRLRLPVGVPVVAFAGALGYDRNKGFDVLFEAWELLCRDPRWEGWLVAAGGGREVDFWRRRATAPTVRGLVRMLGFTSDMPTLMAAADAFVSPTHYDAYGLGVHEALCCGLPAFVTITAGVAERYPAALGDLLLTHPPDATEIAERLRRWHSDIDGYRARVAMFAANLRQRTWGDMARDIVEHAHILAPAPAGLRQA